MNREIKFRGKVADEPNEWVHGYLTNEDSIFQPKETEYTKCCGFGTFAVIPETIGQYTGLKDKNNKEIYEGDILKFSEEDTAVVKWDKKYSYFMVKPIQDYYFDSDVLGHALEYNYDVEIIGNVWEDSELLKEE